MTAPDALKPGAAVTGPEALDKLRYNEAGLIPVVAQDAASGTVLMVAWANREALELTLTTGFMHYWSRSRSALWKKGETSGNLQTVVSLQADCDGDTILARVTMDGPACHTGEDTCFGPVAESAKSTVAAGTTPTVTPGPGPVQTPDVVLTRLWSILEARARERPEGSYTTRLLDDENLRLKKLGEETVEVVTALLRKDARAPEEVADLLYHLLVALLAEGHALQQVTDELARRFPHAPAPTPLPASED
ncbi:MAG: bifunctional phosphoribosyl-AMP cyclohydrolase/phosphoribosyl-ATP diphosphatase HisIE [Gemmatimonadota bacterium]